MVRISLSKAREDFSATVNRAAFKDDRIILERNGQEVAALISIEDLKLLEALEDRHNIELSRKREAEAKRKGEKPVPWEVVKKKLGLK